MEQKASYEELEQKISRLELRIQEYAQERKKMNKNGGPFAGQEEIIL
ncbi:MAG: hypothetical protein HY885_08960 [Deltaproteobacteria bacterium]|nr:hypothetical protein [Deltaproteobacteria bacterium]